MCVVALGDREVEMTKIVLDTGEINSMLCLFEVITRGSVVHEGAVKIFRAGFCFPEFLEHIPAHAVVAAFERLAVNLLKQSIRLSEKGQRLIVISFFKLNDS